MLNRVVPAHSATQNTCKHWSKAPFHYSTNPVPSEIFEVCKIKSVHEQFRDLKIISTKYTQDLKYLLGCRGGRPCFVRNVCGSDLLPGHCWACGATAWSSAGTPSRHVSGGGEGLGTKARRCAQTGCRCQAGGRGDPSTHQPIKYQTVLCRSVPSESF